MIQIQIKNSTCTCIGSFSVFMQETSERGTIFEREKPSTTVAAIFA
jgi:hypothetical protein